LGMILCVFGILMVLQMAIVLGRFSAQIALWEWQLRGSELQNDLDATTVIYQTAAVQRPPPVS
jgi:hypothetical protein